VGPSRRLENLSHARHAIEINAAGRVVMPGFVDAHTHLAFPPAGIRELDPALAMRALHTATGRRLKARSRTYLEALARHGTTTVEVKVPCGLDADAESKLLRMLWGVRRDPIDVVTSFLLRLPSQLKGGSVEATEWVATELLPKTLRRRVAGFADLAWDSGPDLLPCFERYLSVARQLGFGCRIHADGEDLGGPIALAARHRVASIDHLEHATEGQAWEIAEAGLIATLLPGGTSVPPAPARALIDAGGAVALGTNFNPLESPALSMQSVVAWACRRLGMSIEEAISAATINGAHALGCADKVGSLEPGKSADLLILNASHFRDLEFCMGTNLVYLAMKAGRFIYKEGRVEPLLANDLP
jgi:imidazolonepropionase